MADKNESVVAANGYGLAGFLLVINSLASDVKAGRISKPNVIEIIARSRAFLGQFPGDQNVAAFAESSLKMAEQILSASLAETPPARPN